MAERRAISREQSLKPEYGQSYCDYLKNPVSARWRKWLNPQIPYAWNLNRLNLGFILDLGCGVGRNLVNLKGQGVGIEINPYCVQEARTNGLQVFLPEDFKSSAFSVPGRFDSILVSHVVEHMTLTEAIEVVRAHLVYLKPQGRLVLIAPQECGFKRDKTHVEFFGFSELKTVHERLGMEAERQYSFPFPRVFGSVFPHNEFVSISKKVARTLD